MSVCRICNNSEGNKHFRVREMQIGYRDEFSYLECAVCGCLQIEDIPSDLSKYYPNDYYSYSAKNGDEIATNGSSKSIKKRLFQNAIRYHYFGRKNPVGSFVAQRSSLARDYPYWIKQVQLNLKLNSSSRILDVGCGSGKLLLQLRDLGFSNLFGVDPFLKEEIEYDGIKIFNCALDQLSGTFDFIMLHHSFEHIPEPLPTLKRVNQLLKSDRFVLLRIPVAGSYAWEKYGVDWMALDAPRHLHLHTKESVKILTSQAQFELAELFFDSDGIAHWGSELYRRDIPLMDPRSPFVNQNQTTFTKEEMAKFLELDQSLNREGNADSAVFYLYKS